MAMKRKNLPEVVPELFDHEQFGQFRYIKCDEEIWFATVDICRVLEIVNVTQALNRLDDDEKMTLCLNEGHSGQRGGAQFMNFVNEFGLYNLILSSRKLEAKKFKRWVTHEVLLAIRKYGYYSVKQPEQEKIYIEITGDENFKLFKKKYPEIDFEKALRRLGFTKIYDEHGYYHEEGVYTLRFNPDYYEKISRDPLSLRCMEKSVPRKSKKKNIKLPAHSLG